jgi:hypothetical protein
MSSIVSHSRISVSVHWPLADFAERAATFSTIWCISKRFHMSGVCMYRLRRTSIVVPVVERLTTWDRQKK